MPTYEYECRRCGHEFEEFKKISDPPRRRCPKCRGAVRRAIGAGAGVLFKGSGFYVTDYRSEGYKKAAARDKPSSGGSGEKKTPSASPGKGGKKAT